jgi:hypothetical protein
VGWPFIEGRVSADVFNKRKGISGKPLVSYRKLGTASLKVLSSEMDPAKSRINL